MTEYSSPLFIKLETQKPPAFVEKKGKDWVYFGEDNLYPDYLVELYQKSATHNAIVNGKVSYIIGEGWTSTDKGVNIILRSKIVEFLQQINEDEGIEELTEKVSLDFELFNGFYLEVRKVKKGNGFKLNHIPFNKMRTNKDMDTFYYSNDWKNEKGTNPEKTGYKEFKPFDAKITNDVSIYYYKILSPRKSDEPNVYPIPTYIGGTQSIETEIECSNFNLSEIKTGFSAGTMINFNNGIPPKEEQLATKRKIENEMQGSEGAKFILSYSDSKDRSSEVIALNGNDLPERYMNVQKGAMRTIFTAHRVSSPSLFGVQQENVTFGSRAEIAEQYEIFQNTYISHRQKCLETVFNGFAKLKGIPAKLKIKPTKAIQNDIFTEATIVQMLPQEAIKEMIAERMGIDLRKYKVNMSSQCSHDKEELFFEAIEGMGESRDKFEIIKSVDINFTTDLEQIELSFKEEVLPPDVVIPKGVEKGLEKGAEIVYSYEWRVDVPSSERDTSAHPSRPFCKRLIAKDLFYSKAEILRLQNETDLSVWESRGGFWNKDGISTPFCRHVWKANLVKRK
jgi:capsid portal protein